MNNKMYELQCFFQSCINEWNEMPDISSRRPMSPDELSVSIYKKDIDESICKRVVRTVTFIRSFFPVFLKQVL